MSLRARLAVASGAAVALAAVAVALAAYAGTRSSLRGQLDTSLQALASRVLPPGPGGGPDGPPAGEIIPSGPVGGPPPFAGGIAPAFGGAAGSFNLLHPDGTVSPLRGQRYRIPTNAAIRRVAASGQGRAFADLTSAGLHLRVLATGIGPAGALLVALPLGDVDRVLHHQLLITAVIVVAAVLLALVLAALVTRTALQPVARLSEQVQAAAAGGEMTGRVDPGREDELGGLARTFNRTLDALEHSLQAQRNLVADASHELRTPISSLRANLQLLADADALPAEEREGLRNDMISELDELTGLVSDVVELARGAKPVEASDDIRLDELIAEIVERMQRRAPGVMLEAELEPTLVRGDGVRIARAVSNLLDNARKWSPPDGRVEVVLRDGVVGVRDHGPGFSDADLPRVFDRFHRSSAARGKPGSGLGLAIVRQTAEAHGGRAEAANAPGGGAIVTVSFGAATVPGEALPAALESN